MVSFGLCIAVLATLMATSTADSFRRERARASAELHVVAQHAAEDDAEVIPTALQFLNDIAAQPAVASLDPDQCRNALKGLAVLSAGANVYLLGPDGTTVCSLDEGPNRIGLPEGDWLDRVRAEGAPFVGPATLDRTTGLPVFVLATPVPLHPAAVLVGVMGTSQQELRALPNAAHEVSLIELDEARELILATSKGSPQKVGPIPKTDWLRSTFTTDRTHRDTDGVVRLYHEVAVPELHRVVLAGIPLSVALAEAQAEKTRNIQTMVGVILAIALLGLWMRRRIAKPMRGLQVAISEAAEDHTVRAAAVGPREVAAVAEAFNATMSERNSLQCELARALDEARDASRLKSQFLANMSHEIRTPMNGVLGLLSLLIEMDLSDEVRDYVATMSISADALMVILNDLLDFSKLEAGMVEPERLPFELRACISAAANPAKVLAEAKGLRFEITVLDCVPDHLVGDAGRLRQVLANLLDNAIKFTPRGSVTLRVSVDEADMLRFEVRDTGIGVAEEDQPALFAPFVQADGTTTRRFGGTGLGLSICRQLVDLMGGAIGVESNPGAGAVFTFILPLCVDSAPLSVPAPTLTGAPRVLVVEDNVVNQQVATQLLRTLGFDAVVAPEGAAAIVAVTKQSFDAILMDLQMPGMDGFTTTSELRQRGCVTPVVAMTASALGTDRERCRTVGMDGYLAKPMTANALRSELGRVIGSQMIAS